MKAGTRLDAYKIVLDRQDDDSWVAEAPAIAGSYPPMPTREKAFAEVGLVVHVVGEESSRRHEPGMGGP